MYNNARMYLYCLCSMIVCVVDNEDAANPDPPLILCLEPFHAQVEPPLLHLCQLCTPISLRHDSGQSFP